MTPLAKYTLNKPKVRTVFWIGDLKISTTSPEWQAEKVSLNIPTYEKAVKALAFFRNDPHYAKKYKNLVVFEETKTHSINLRK